MITIPFQFSFLLSRNFRRWFQQIIICCGICFFLMTSKKVFGQDPVFSQFYLSPLQLNPGLSGLTEDPRFSANYRNQFPGFNNAYRTYALSYDQFFPNLNGGIGAWLLSDDAGDGILKTIKAAGIFSYRLRIKDNLYAKTGIEVGVVQSTLNWNKLIFGDQIDDYVGTISPGGIPFPTEETAPDKNKVIYPDLGIGMVLYGGDLYTGISVKHLNRPDPDFLSINSNLSPRIPMRWTLHAGASWPVFSGLFNNNFEVNFSPSVIVVKQGPLNQINGGFTMDADVITVGLHYRISSGRSEAFIGSIGFRTNQLRVGYSFDYTISGFPLSGGTHEIGIVYHLDDGDTESRYNDCLNIFR
jgi:type IX secretion system PorP/SprF family membrane protein